MLDGAAASIGVETTVFEGLVAVVLSVVGDAGFGGWLKLAPTVGVAHVEAAGGATNFSQRPGRSAPYLKSSTRASLPSPLMTSILDE